MRLRNPQPRPTRRSRTRISFILMLLNISLRSGPSSRKTSRTNPPRPVKTRRTNPPPQARTRRTNPTARAKTRRTNPKCEVQGPCVPFALRRHVLSRCERRRYFSTPGAPIVAFPAKGSRDKRIPLAGRKILPSTVALSGRPREWGRSTARLRYSRGAPVCHVPCVCAQQADRAARRPC